MTANGALLPALKVGACVTLFSAVLLGLFTALVDRQGPVRRAWDLYIAHLERKLRGMFLRTPGRHIALGQLAAALLLGVLVSAVELPYPYVFVGLIGFAPAYYLERLKRKRTAEIERQLDPFILSLANALKAIPSVSAAFQSVVETSASPIREEIELCNREMRVGSTLEEALVHMATRVGSIRLDSAIAAVILGRQLGGNLPRVLENTAGSMREMYRLEGVLRSKTSEAKMQLYVIGAAPFFLLTALSVLSPGYFDPLHESTTGQLVGIGAVGSWLLALYMARKILAVSL